MKKLDKKILSIILLATLVIVLGIRAYVQPYLAQRHMDDLRYVIDQYINYTGDNDDVRNRLITNIYSVAKQKKLIKPHYSSAFPYIDFPICSFLAWRISEVTEFGDGYYNPETEVYWPGEPVNTPQSEAAVHTWVSSGCLNGLEW